MKSLPGEIELRLIRQMFASKVRKFNSGAVFVDFRHPRLVKSILLVCNVRCNLSISFNLLRRILTVSQKMKSERFN